MTISKRLPKNATIVLENDLRLFGNSYVEKTGDGYGRRVDPANIAMRQYQQQAKDLTK